MKKVIHPLKKKQVIFTSFIICFMFLTTLSKAQFRDYDIVYSDNIKGNITLFGNTLLHIINDNVVNTIKMNGNNLNGNSIYGNDKENMQYVDIDGNIQEGVGTRNSSSSDLILPAGANTIKLARLYWGGRVRNSEFDLIQNSNKKIKIRKGNAGPYTDFTAIQLDKNTVIKNEIMYSQYQAYADITNFMQSNGAGIYTVGNAPLSVGSIDGGGNYGGWCIVVVYENQNLDYNSLRLYDGFQEVYDGGDSLTTTVTLTGLNVPSGVLIGSDAKMGILSWEGDANLNGDYLKINDILFSNGINQSNNPWNGTISNNGVHVTTKAPNYTNQLGLDIDQFNVGIGYGITPNANSVSLKFGTEADQYFPGLFSFVIKMKDPTINLDKIVSDANNNTTVEVNEVLTYTLKGKNMGIGNANNVKIIDTLPDCITYVPNSLKVIKSPGMIIGSKTDGLADDVAEFILDGTTQIVVFRIGAGANAVNGGKLATNEEYEVQFQATVSNPGEGKLLSSIINTARVQAQSDAGEDFVDDGIAIMDPLTGGVLGVNLSYFKSSLMPDRYVRLDWGTSAEKNFSHYEVQKSLDGQFFNTFINIQGNGTTGLRHDYSTQYDVSAINSAIIYFRLKEVDLDGKISYSKIVSIHLKKQETHLTVAPNPFINTINIKFESSKNEMATLKIIDNTGKNIINKNVQINKGFNDIKLDADLEKLPKGYYILKFSSSTEDIIKKILKQ